MSITYRFRDATLNNLIADKRLTGPKRNDILKKLGAPTLIDTNYIITG